MRNMLTSHQMDFFNWNFGLAFVIFSAVITVGSVLPSAKVEALSMPILVTEVSGQLLVAAISTSFRLQGPVRISSVAHRKRFRPRTYSVVEDIMAVDGGYGQRFRQELESRYLASPVVKKLFWEMDVLWGTTGIVAGVGYILLVALISNNDVAWSLGKTTCREIAHEHC